MSDANRRHEYEVEELEVQEISDKGKERRRSRSYSRERHRRDRRSRTRSRSPSYRRSKSRSYSPRRRRRSPSDDYSGRNGGNDYSNSRYGGSGGGGYSTGSKRRRSRSPFSRRRRHMGDRDQPEPSRVLGVFGLSLRTDERDLRDVFDKYGGIEQIQIIYDHQTGRSRGFGFVYFEDVADAEDAKREVTGAELDGRIMRVDYSITKRAHTPTPGMYLGRPDPASSRRYGGRSEYNNDYGRSRRSRSYSPRRY